MRFAVDAWAPDYGAPAGDEALAESTTDVDPWVERDADSWAPIAVAGGDGAVGELLFVDGVRRVEANVWIDAGGETHHGICASYAAGAIRCCALGNGSRGGGAGERGKGGARLAGSEVRHGLFSLAEGAVDITTRYSTFVVHPVARDDPGDLTLRLQKQMARLEVRVAREHRGNAGLVVVDGPLRDGHDEPQMVGYVKTHSRSYGPALVREVVAALACGERTPVFLIGGPRPRFSWYMRLPCVASHGWAGVVRLEAAADRQATEAVALAGRVAATIPRYASVPQKDPRAPQNLYPIGGLERELRRRLGDPTIVYRSLCEAAARAGPGRRSDQGRR